MAVDGQTVVLRIKRKRTDDPLDAFLVAHSIKRAHLSGENADKEDAPTATFPETTATVDKVYQLVGTVCEGDDTKKQDLLKKLETTRKSHSAKARLHNVSKIQEKVRKNKKVSHQKARFKVIGQHRSHSEESDELSGQINDTDAEIQQLLNIYDVVRDEQTQGSESRKKADEPSQADGVNSILCNSVKMIREKLTVSNTPETKVETKMEPASCDDYVYDFYYPTDNSSPMGDIVEVLPFNERLVFEDMEQEFNEIYEDEDDSNDEDNWRNDYPDEGHWESDDSENKRHFGDYGFDSDEEYRMKAFEGAELSSDDEDFAYFGQRYAHGKMNKNTDSELYHEELSDST